MSFCRMPSSIDILHVLLWLSQCYSYDFITPTISQLFLVMVKVVIATLKAASARIKDISFSYNATIEESNCQEIFNACNFPPAMPFSLCLWPELSNIKAVTRTAAAAKPKVVNIIEWQKEKLSAIMYMKTATCFKLDRAQKFCVVSLGKYSCLLLWRTTFHVTTRFTM